VSKRQEANARLLEEIKSVCRESRSTYGSPRIRPVLRRKGLSCGRLRMAHLMAKAHVATKTRCSYRVTAKARAVGSASTGSAQRVFDA